MTQPVPDPVVEITQYTVSCVPRTNINRHNYEIYIDRSKKGCWGVDFEDPMVWSVSDGFMYYSNQSNGRFHYPQLMRLEEAMELAKQLAPKIIINGHTVADAIAFGKEDQ